MSELILNGIEYVRKDSTEILENEIKKLKKELLQENVKIHGMLVQIAILKEKVAAFELKELFKA
jgi:hypothetical protein